MPLKVCLPTADFVSSPTRTLWLDLSREVRGHPHDDDQFWHVAASQAPASSSDALTSICKIGIGGEAISPRTLRLFLAWGRRMGLREDAAILGYGLSECGPIVGGATPFNLMDASDEDAFVRLDRPTAGHAVRIVDDSGRPVVEGIIGNVEVTGATLASGYYGDEAATARMFTTDGWLKTGDLGRLDDGTLSITGRVKEVISINARKYACAEIEAIAEQIPVVREAYAVPLGDGVATGGKQSPFALFVVAPFVPASGFPALADRIRRSVAAVIGLAPRSIHAIREDDVPRTTTGKVRRLELPQIWRPAARRRPNRRRLSSAPRPRPARPLTTKRRRRSPRLWRGC